MPKYRVQLKQGKRTITEYIEAKDLNSLLAFYNTISTMQVSGVLKVEYENKSLPPVDDFNYYSIVKVFARNNNRQAKQFIFHNVKPSVSETDLINAIKSNLEINGFSVDSTIINLWKR